MYCVLCIGGGGAGFTNDTYANAGGGAGLRYINNIPVQPGQVISLSVGSAGVGSTSPTPGGDSWFNGTSALTASIWAGGGTQGTTTGGTGGVTEGTTPVISNPGGTSYTRFEGFLVTRA